MIMEENLILILENNRIQVNKEKLAARSRYFGSLFSGNFNDSHNKEHTINYDISLATVQNFVEWINDDDKCVTYNQHQIKYSMTKFMSDHFSDLLHLLSLSALFVVDDLIDDIVDIIVLFWLIPEKVVDIWILSQELGIKTLQDIALVVCLERFEELRVSSLVQISKDNITHLLQNVNVIASTEYLEFVRKEWIQRHKTLDLPVVRRERQPRYIQAMFVYEVCEDDEIDACLYTWNGTTLSRFLELRNELISDQWLKGMQVTGGGFSIYTVGGETSIGSGKFNNFVWRYCLISKKWYYQAKLPRPRRHMVLAFLNNKLILVGGVGRHRLKLFTVDILDVRTDTWSHGATVPESFIEVPDHCVMDGKLFVIKSAVYIYYPEEDYWTTIAIQHTNALLKNGACLAYNATMFISGEYLDETVLSRIFVKDAVLEESDCHKQCLKQTTITDTVIMYQDDNYQLRYAEIVDTGFVVVNNRRNENYRYLYAYSEFRSEFDYAIVPQIQCFNLIDPDTLYKTV